MKELAFLVAVAASSLLVGCGKDVTAEDTPIATSEVEDTSSPPIVRDVQYFLDNPEDRRALRQECRNNPGALRNNAECINADEANKQARARRTREILGK